MAGGATMPPLAPFLSKGGWRMERTKFYDSVSRRDMILEADDRRSGRILAKDTDGAWALWRDATADDIERITADTWQYPKIIVSLWDG